MKKIISLLLSVTLVTLLLFLPAVPVFADDEPIFVVSSETNVTPGSDVAITVSVKNSPDIASIKLTVNFSEDLTLTAVSYNPAIGGLTQEPETLSRPVILNWISLEPVSGDFLFATLYFTTSENPQIIKNNIELTFNPADICDIDENNIAFESSKGIIAFKHIPGDINFDGEVNNKDLTRLFQYLSEWDVTVNEAALDVNGDGDVNNKDLTRLFQYLSEWDVEIY